MSQIQTSRNRVQSLLATGSRHHLDRLILPFSILLLVLLQLLQLLLLLCNVGQYSSVGGRSLLETYFPLLSTWPTLKTFWHVQGRGRDEMKSIRVAIRQRLDVFALQLPARLLIVLSTTKSMVEVFVQSLSKPIKWSQSGWPKVFKWLGNSATWWAILYLPTGMAAHELKGDDEVTGYGPAAGGAALLMFKLLVLKVRDKVQGCMNSLIDSVRRSLEMLLYMVLVTGLLAAMVLVPASAFKDVNHFKGNDSIADLLLFGRAPISVALIPCKGGKCRTCNKSPCVCPIGPGTGTGTDSTGAGTESLAASAIGLGCRKRFVALHAGLRSIPMTI